jgi:hypothetical protein
MQVEIAVNVDIPDWLTCLTLDELEVIDTLVVGQADDLKIDNEGFRVWLSRSDTYDGMPYDNAVTIEKLIDNRWIEVLMYEAN